MNKYIKGLVIKKFFFNIKVLVFIYKYIYKYKILKKYIFKYKVLDIRNESICNDIILFKKYTSNILIRII